MKSYTIAINIRIYSAELTATEIIVTINWKLYRLHMFSVWRSICKCIYWGSINISGVQSSTFPCTFWKFWKAHSFRSSPWRCSFQYIEINKLNCLFPNKQLEWVISKLPLILFQNKSLCKTFQKWRGMWFAWKWKCRWNKFS